MDAERVRHVGRQVILPYKRRSGKVAEEERFHLGGANLPIFQALLAGFHGQRPQVTIREGAKSRLANTHHGNRSHIISLGQIHDGKQIPRFPRWRVIQM